LAGEWTVEPQPEVGAWFVSLRGREKGRVSTRIDLLKERGVELGEPHTRQLRGKLRELRFNLGGQRLRIAYYLASGRRIILLTVFKKTQARENREIDRAERAMRAHMERHRTDR
jgi:hypothetical protein